MFKDEIVSLRHWNASVCKVLVFVYNYLYKKYTFFDISLINDRMWRAKKERINKFLFDNNGFKWRDPSEKMEGV
jgi:hypothetical protein